MPEAAETLLETTADGVRTLAFNRPERLNALDVALFTRLLERLREAAEQSDVKVIVVSGVGRAFSSGGDLKEDGPVKRALTPDERIDRVRRLSEISLILHRAPKPTIASMRGAAAGAGLSIALACDLRIASETAALTTAFARGGFSGDYGISYLLHHLVGPAKARELLFFSEKVPAQEALALGLVNQLAPDVDLETRTTEMALRLAKGPTVAFRHMKRNLNAAETATFEEVLDIEAANMIRSILTADHEEAVRAFVEKRAPAFKGR